MTGISMTPNARKLLMAVLVSVFLALGIAYSVYYILVLSHYEVTDDAYVAGNLVMLTSQVNGTVTDIRTDDMRFVHAGEKIVSLDPTDAAVALTRAAAQLGETARQLRQHYANARQYRQIVVQRKAELMRAQSAYQRRQPLVADQIVANEEIEYARATVNSALAALKAAIYQAQGAQALVDGVDIRHHPRMLKAKADFTQAWLATRRNALLAPVSGYVAKRNVQVGTRVHPGLNLLSIVPLNQLWIIANFKEAALANIRIGQPVVVTADVYRGQVEYHGRVEGLSAGTGSSFSLLPAQNATGNWIKVVQRVPVRISLSPDELARYPLRIGLSTTVKISVKDRQGPMLGASPSADQLAYTTTVVSLPLQQAEREANKIIARTTGPDR